MVADRIVSPHSLPVAFKVEMKPGRVVISAMKQSARGTRYLAGRQIVETQGKSREQFRADVLKAIQSLAPGYPTNA